MSLFSCCYPKAPSLPEPEDLLSENNPRDTSEQVKYDDKRGGKYAYGILTERNSDRMVAPSANVWLKSRVCLLLSMFIALVAFFVYVQNDYIQDIVVASQPSRTYEFTDENDHMEVPLEKLNITDDKRQLIELVYRSEKLQEHNIVQLAAETGVQITPHLVYRYYMSGEWTPAFYGKSYADAIIDTINWRKTLKIWDIREADVLSFVKLGQLYTNGHDKKGRSIVYAKFTAKMSHFKESDSHQILLSIMHTVEKADRLSVKSGAGEFIVIVDLRGLSWETCPPLNILKKAIGLLKRHFPHRLHAIYIVNVGIVFEMIWNLLKPVIPKRAIQKTIILKRADSIKILGELVGYSNLEDDLGGQFPRLRFNDAAVVLDYIKNY